MVLPIILYLITTVLIIHFQEQISTDIATILDIPTGWKVSRHYAEWTINETLRRANRWVDTKTREDILWVGPIQGGRYFDLIVESATQMGKLPFDIFALGSPTEVMQNYRFDVLVDMIINAKMNLPFDKPLHLFGAGHPLTFSLAVALGCDFFDSAAYALFARDHRYITEMGTKRLSALHYFPCSCPHCSSSSPKEVQNFLPNDIERFLAAHNLYVCLTELDRIKQAIREGRLWELLEIRAHSHPALIQAVKTLKKYAGFLEQHSPSTKKRGLFYNTSLGLTRPEITRYRKRLSERYLSTRKSGTLLLLPSRTPMPLHKSWQTRNILKLFNKFHPHLSSLQVAFYVPPFGIVPIELDEIYPLSQHVTAFPLDHETIKYVVSHLTEFITCSHYNQVIPLH